MNLHGIVAPIIGAVNPLIPVSIQVSAGRGTTNPDGSPNPTYATPGAIVGSISGTTLTVTSQASGVLQIGQTLAGSGVELETSITGLLGGTGGLGTYSVSVEHEVGPVDMATSLVLLAQIQPISTRDLAQLDGINLGGVRWKAYLNGEVDSIVRPERKGGDLITISSGRHQGVWLVIQVIEQFPDWCSCAIVQQNGA